MIGTMIWVFAAVGFCWVCVCADGTRDLLQTTSATDSIVEEYVWRATVGSRAPDCFQRDVILVNGTFQPTLVITHGQYLQVSCNETLFVLPLSLLHSGHAAAQASADATPVVVSCLFGAACVPDQSWLGCVL